MGSVNKLELELNNIKNGIIKNTSKAPKNKKSWKEASKEEKNLKQNIVKIEKYQEYNFQQLQKIKNFPPKLNIKKLKSCARRLQMKKSENLQ